MFCFVLGEKTPSLCRQDTKSMLGCLKYLKIIPKLLVRYCDYHPFMLKLQDGKLTLPLFSVETPSQSSPTDLRMLYAPSLPAYLYKDPGSSGHPLLKWLLGWPAKISLLWLFHGKPLKYSIGHLLPKYELSLFSHCSIDKESFQQHSWRVRRPQEKNERSPTDLQITWQTDYWGIPLFARKM